MKMNQKIYEALQFENEAFRKLAAMEISHQKLRESERKRLWPQLLKARRSACRCLSATDQIRENLKQRVW